MIKPPAFQLYASDFYMDTAGWTVAQVGAYTRLLMYEWVNGHIPSDMASLARIAGISDVRTMYKMWQQTLVNKFTSNGGNLLYNRRLEEEREKQAKYRESQVEKGKSGASKRWKDHIAPAILVSKPEYSSSSSSSIKRDKSLSCLHQEIVEKYNDILSDVLPHVKYNLWSGSVSERNLRARWREDTARQKIEFWEGLFGYIRKCPFLMGGVKPDFRATLHWILKKENFIKIVEGAYEKR